MIPGKLTNQLALTVCKESGSGVTWSVTINLRSLATSVVSDTDPALIHRAHYFGRFLDYPTISELGHYFIFSFFASLKSLVFNTVINDKFSELCHQ